MLFQYIPCYGLSTSDIIENDNNNTFQYIPCYGLSSKICNVHVRYTKFQYIPCYGLSWMVGVFSCRINNFNTSHVTVYLRTHNFR